MNYFPKNETSCKCGCGGDITDEFRDFLNRVREDVGAAMYVTSGMRCTAYDSSIGGKGRHPTGEAADVACRGVHGLNVLKYALAHGAKAIGTSQKGRHSSRFLHIDIIKDKSALWSY